MKNDLTQFEKNLLRIINVINGTHYNYKHFMEWSSSKKQVEKNLREGEVMYEALGFFVAIKK
jgi:hypothetical protein